ncbi:MAG: DUF2085 domain-containing protein [Anaerolineales bacterium]|nr:DUF2085 domain-containing protein [Anaerolineales bacterium]
MRVTFYTKDDCSLCVKTKAWLGELKDDIPHTLVEVDIESEPSLQARYEERVPVVEVGPYTLEAPFDKRDLKVAMLSAQAGLQQDGESVEPKSNPQGLRLNKGLLFFARHWLAAFNLLVFLYVGLPFAAPVLMQAGAERPARWIYTAYSPMCHQLAFRSWFLFGDQPAYPRELAGVNLTPFEEATGIPGDDLWAARDFVGNEQVGYKVAFCERDVAIYGGILLAGLLYSQLRDKLKPLPLWAWVLFGVVPIGLDGGTQLISELPLPIISAFPARESTPFLRTLTGGLFGIMNVWLAYPYVEETMGETRAVVSAKIKAADERAEQAT